jgi:hypothetical protein
MVEFGPGHTAGIEVFLALQQERTEYRTPQKTAEKIIDLTVATMRVIAQGIRDGAVFVFREAHHFSGNYSEINFLAGGSIAEIIRVRPWGSEPQGEEKTVNIAGTIFVLGERDVVIQRDKNRHVVEVRRYNELSDLSPPRRLNMLTSLRPRKVDRVK